MVEIVIGILEAIGGYLRDFKNLSNSQKIGFLFILIGIIFILVVILVISLKYSSEV